MQAEEWRLSDFKLRLGRSSLRGEFARTGIGTKPLITAKVDVDLIDVVELETIRPPAEERPRQATKPGQGTTLDLPILPASMPLSDADVEVKVKRVALQATDVTDASFTGRHPRRADDPFAVCRQHRQGAVQRRRGARSARTDARSLAVGGGERRRRGPAAARFQGRAGPGRSRSVAARAADRPRQPAGRDAREIGAGGEPGWRASDDPRRQRQAADRGRAEVRRSRARCPSSP